MVLKRTRKSRQLQAEKFNRAQALHRQGALAEARALYRSILAVEPDHADALHFLGFLSYQTGDAGTALKLIRQSLQLQPDNAAAINNLGNVLLDEGQLQEAESCYRKVIEQQPGEASNLSNLCVVLRKQDRLSEAIEAGRTSVQMDPRSAMGWYTLGNAYKVARRERKAIECFQRSVELDPKLTLAHDALCQVTYRRESRHWLGRRGWKKSIRAYQQWLSAEPNHPLARFMLENLQGGRGVTRASDEVVRTQFDQMAGNFEKRLNKLEYRVPALVDRVLRNTLGDGRGDLAVLDGGCGTGLCAATLKRYAAHLTGADLSPGMLRQAEQLHLYDELIEQELTAFVQAHTERFDLVVYADTLCYFGDLGDISKATAAALRGQGHVVFSVEERFSDSGYLANPNGRYAHSRDYVESVLQECGLAVRECSQEFLRLEAGREVPGLMVVAQR